MTSEFVVLPTHAHAAFARAEEALADPRGVAMGRGVMTLGELVEAVVAAALPGLRVLGPLEERLVMRRVASSELAREGRFGRVVETPGFIGALGATVATCRKAGVESSSLRAVEGTLPRPVAERALAVADLLEEVDRHLARLEAADREGALWRVAEALRDGAPLPVTLPAGSRVVLRHIHELSPARLAFFDALALRLGAAGDVVVELPHDTCEGPWFAATNRVLSRAEAGGAAASLTLLPMPPIEHARGEGAFVAEALCQRPPSSASAAAIEVIHAPSPESEHRLVARRVRDLVDGGMPPERIAVAARDVDSHAGPLAEALRGAGVPVHERRGTPASETPPLRFLFDVMTAAAEGLSRDVLLRLMASSYAARWAESRGPAGELSRVLGQVGVRHERHERRKSRADAALLDALDRFAGDADAPRTLPMVKGAVADFAERARALGEPATIVELIARVRRFVDVSGLADAVTRPTGGLAELIAQDGGESVAAAEARAFGRDQAALDALELALDELAEATERVGFVGKLEPGVCAALLRDALKVHAVGSFGLRGGAVRVVGLRDLAGLPVDAAFLVGLRDGELPAPIVDDPLLSTSDRFAIARALAGRSDGPRYTFDVAEDTRMGAVAFATGREVEPLLFYLAAVSPRERLVLSRSTTDDDGRPVGPSPILEDALDALGRAGAAVLVSAPPLSPAPALERAASYDDARRALVRAFAEVGPATSAAEAAALDPRPALPDDDPLGVADLAGRVMVERKRIASMLSAESDVVAGPFGGQLGDAHGARPEKMSATALEDLARCPFLYFAKRVLRLVSDKAGEDDPDARQKGTVAHACFQAAIEALVDGGFVPYDQARIDEAMVVARRAAEAVAGPRFAALPLDPHLLALVRDQQVDRVVAVVREIYAADDGFAPVAVEQGFGPASARDGGVDVDDARWPSIEAGGLALHGRIDLVEQRGDFVRVTDLKSGTKQNLDKKLQPDELGWAELQLPIYGAAAAAALGAEGVDARYLSLRDGAATASVLQKRTTGTKWKKDSRTEEDLFAVAGADGKDTALGGRIRDLVERIAYGDFEVLPRKNACRLCDYAGICRLPRGAPDAEEGA